MDVRIARLRTCATMFAAAASVSFALCACGKSTQSVGHLKAEGALMNAGNTPRDSVASLPFFPPNPINIGQAGQTASGSPSGSGGNSSLADGGVGMSIGGDGGPGDVAVAPPPPPPPPECHGVVMSAPRRELDLYLMVDNLITIPASSWMKLIRGLKRYVDDPRANGTGLGVGFLGFVCDAQLSDQPTVGIRTLPGNRTAIDAAIDLALPFNLSPLDAALKGSLVYARSIANTYRDRKVALVLVTDTVADTTGCGDVTSLSSDARTGLTGNPSIPTYIMATVENSLFKLTLSPTQWLTNPTIMASNLGPLSQIAAAGGTTQAYPYDATSEPDNTTAPSPFADTMVRIQKDAEPCDYAVPDSVPDDATGVWLIEGNGTMMPRLASPTDCGDGYTWTTTPDGKRWAHLCDDTCSAVKTRGSALSWVTQCKL